MMPMHTITKANSVPMLVMCPSFEIGRKPEKSETNAMKIRLQRQGVRNFLWTSENTLGSSGVWIAGGGIAADSGGNIYFPTGNGTWNGTTDYGNSIVKLGPPSGGSFSVVSYFTPWDQASLYAKDLDVSSGGLILLPTTKSGLNLLAQQGKQGTIVLLNQSN